MCQTARKLLTRTCNLSAAWNRHVRKAAEHGSPAYGASAQPESGCGFPVLLSTPVPAEGRLGYPSGQLTFPRIMSSKRRCQAAALEGGRSPVSVSGAVGVSSPPLPSPPWLFRSFNQFFSSSAISQFLVLGHLMSHIFLSSFSDKLKLQR